MRSGIKALCVIVTMGVILAVVVLRMQRPQILGSVPSELVGWWKAAKASTKGFQGYSFDSEGRMFLLGYGEPTSGREHDAISGLSQLHPFDLQYHRRYFLVLQRGEEGEDEVRHRVDWQILSGGKTLRLSSRAKVFPRDEGPALRLDPFADFYRIK